MSPIQTHPIFTVPNGTGKIAPLDSIILRRHLTPRTHGYCGQKEHQPWLTKVPFPD